MKKIFYSFILCTVCFLLYTRKVHSQDLIVKTEAREFEKKAVVKYGIASFYANKFNGRKTSTGAIYNSSILSAACNQLPLGTCVRVTNLRNKKSIVVEINDHLHYKNKRLIDLSRTAAQKLGFISRGITRVKVEVLDPEMQYFNL